MKILFAASEAVPFAASGGLADVAGSLPKAIKSKRHDCRVVIPLYKSIRPEIRDKMVFLASITTQETVCMDSMTTVRDLSSLTGLFSKCLSI